MSEADRSALATPDHPVRSPSGRYLLEVVYGKDQYGARVGWFRIRAAEGARELVYESDERFALRHTTMFLWADHADQVWVYSGDVGTSYWEPDPRTGEWTERVWQRDGSAPPPSLLKKARPQFFGSAGGRP